MVPALTALLTLLQGCTPLPLISGETLYVMVARQRRLDWLRRTDIDAKFWAPLLKEYGRLHPNVRVSIFTVSENELVAELRKRTARGLGPDLILARAPVTNTLLREGLIAPVPSTPAMNRTLAQVMPVQLNRVRNGVDLSGLPYAELVTLACYNRKTIPDPPRTTSELMARAAAGRTIGLSIDAYGLWWTAGTMNAADSLEPLLLGEAPANALARQQMEQKITAWLTWLRQLVGQSRVDLASGPEELTDGLIKGRLDWIPCYSLTLDTLKEGMGERLGVSALPRGPGGSPSPFNSLHVWAFGLDSSARQQQNAAALAQLSVDPVLQRRVVLESQEVLPVNRFVEIPVASSGVLAALKEAGEQFESETPIFRQPFDLRRMNILVPQMESVIQQVMVGVLTPVEGTRWILRLAEPVR